MSSWRIEAPIGALFTASLMLVAAGCPPSTSSQESESRTVAVVNDQSIDVEVLQQAMHRFRREHGQMAFRTESDVEAVRKHLLDDAITRLLVREAAENLGISIDNEEVERALLRSKSPYPDRAFEEYLVEAGMPLSELREEILHRLLLKEIFREAVNPRVIVTEEEVREAYEEDPAAWALKEQVRARQIIVGTKEEARRLHRQLRGSADFAELAERHSLGPEGERGGDLGWFTRGTMPPPIGEVCFSLPENRLSEVIESPYGFHIFEVVERREARPRPLDEVSSTIANELQMAKEQEAQQAYLKRLREEASLTIHQEVLAEVR